MKWHRSLEECFANSKLPESMRQAFEDGWFACANEINNGLDSDMVQAELKESGFFRKDEE